MKRVEAPPEIVSLTGDSHVREGERVFDTETIHAHVRGDNVRVWFENPLYDHPDYDIYEAVEADSVADALRKMADIVEEATDD